MTHNMNTLRFAENNVLDFKNLDNAMMIVIFFCPGLIITYLRMQFLTGRAPKHQEALLTYFIVTIIYYSAVYTIADLFYKTAGLNIFWRENTWLERAMIVFVIPIIVGITLGASVQNDFARNLIRRLRLNPVHPLGTAWDWSLSKCGECYVLVTLKNDIIYRGYIGGNSFSSSTESERDIYLERLYELDNKNGWIQREGRSILITSGEIRSIEFINLEEGSVRT